jgi:phage gp36-like protein
MSNYIQVSDLTPARIPKLKLLQLVDDDKEGFTSGGDFQTDHYAIMNALIATAENTAEGIASKRYSVAGLRAAKPPVFVERVKDLAEVMLYERRPPLYPASEQKRKDAIAWLNSLKTGFDALGLDTPVAEKPSTAGGHAATVHDPKPQMDRESLEGF